MNVPPESLRTAVATPLRRQRKWARLRHRFVELVIVFAGVYTAFLLNRFDSSRHDARRRSQILAALERESAAGVDELRVGLAQADRELGEFKTALAAGDMPKLFISLTNSGYSSNDDATLLQSGGVDLLDIETIERIRRVNTLHREVDSEIHNQFELSLMTLTNRSQEDYYDPATHQLKPDYQWYPRLLGNLIADAKDLLVGEEDLLRHLRQLNGKPPSPSPSPSPK